MARISNFTSNFNGGIRSNLFRMEVDGLGEKLTFMCKGAQLPGKTIGEIEVPFLDMKIAVAGDVVFEPLNLTIILDTDFAIRNEIESWMEEIHNNNASIGQDPTEYYRSGNLIVLGRKETELAEYRFENLWPTTLSSVDLNFESSDTVAEYTCDFRYTHWTRIF